MPDPGPGLSRRCPSCGRRVPKAVAVCRCGLEVLAAEEEPGGMWAAEGRRSPASLAIAAMLIAALVAAGYWSLSLPPAAEIPAPASPGPALEELAQRGDDTPPPAAAPAMNWSPVRRAWEAERTLADRRPADTDAPPVPPGPGTTPPAPSIEDVVDRVMPAVVLVDTSSGRGSGFFVRPDTVITNVHVVKDDGLVTLRRIDGTTATARVAVKSPAFDIAVLKVASPAADQAVIAMGSADSLRPGQEVIMIGSALGTLQNSVTRGIVSGVRRSGDATLVQTDAAANPGNSGGPLLDRNGVAIGITTMGYRDQQGLNFAVAIDHARAIIEGRMAASTSAPLAMNQLPTLTPAVPTETERVRDQGQRAFLVIIAQVARLADALDGDWQRFRISCFTEAVGGSFSREWFVMLSPRPITPAQSGGGSCTTFLAAFQKQAVRVATEMRDALDQARRASVTPGVIRETLQSNRLEFDGWDR